MENNIDKISVIIPVHNGSKYLNRFYDNLKKQSYKNLEIIFVENYSKDNSADLLNAIKKVDSRVKVLESKIPGTSMARKMGVEHASGKYIVFMDQDDKYINKYALERMHKTIDETNTSICQFSIYKEYAYGIKKISKIIDKRTILSAQDVREKEIGSIFESYGGGVLSPTVWSKIYTADVVKDAVKKVNNSLYFAEDLFLNTCCFCSDKLKSVCVDPSAYYVWNTRVGFSSSSDSGKALIKDYNLIKPQIHQMLIETHAGEDVIYRLHLESLYFMLNYLRSQFDDNNLQHTYDLITEINSLPYIKLAKKYVNDDMDEKRRFDELMFLASDFTPKEFYDRFKQNDSSKKESITKRVIKWLLK